MNATGWARWLAPAAVLALSISGAAAQLKPWPGQQTSEPQQKSWPGDNAPAASGAAQPAALPTPMSAPPPMAQSPMMSAPGMGGPPSGASSNPCIVEFTRLRGEVERAGKATKAVSDRKASREEFCKAVTNLHTTQAKWVKYAADNAQHCGIPAQIVTQLKTGLTNLGKMRTNVCNGGATAGNAPAAPSLAEALGTARMPVTEEAPKKRGGTLETLTGEVIR